MSDIRLPYAMLQFTGFFVAYLVFIYFVIISSTFINGGPVSSSLAILGERPKSSPQCPTLSPTFFSACNFVKTSIIDVSY